MVTPTDAGKPVSREPISRDKVFNEDRLKKHGLNKDDSNKHDFRENGFNGDRNNEHAGGEHVFSEDYGTARERFRQAAQQLNWSLEAHPITARGPQGEELTLDVALSPPEATAATEADGAGRVLVVSSGLHGVEGFFGSAVQLALLEHWAATAPPACRCVLLHGLNPFGFAWLRRVDENNVDPNRNFLQNGAPFQGAAEGYDQLDAFLNPRRPPSRWDPYLLKALLLIARYGLPSLRQAIAGGQYEHPQGLFFGGHGPSQMQGLLREHLPRWLGGSQVVLHLDLHSGLGPRGTCKLLLDDPLDARRTRWMRDWFGADTFAPVASCGMAYEARGSMGRWCLARGIAPHYLFACAEFGTYGSVRVLGGLRAENQAHHWGADHPAATIRARRRLRELFCPDDPRWRAQVLERSLDLVARAQRGLSDLPHEELVSDEPAPSNAAPRCDP